MQGGLPAAGANGPEERFQALVEQLPAIVYIASNDPVPDTLYVSPQLEALLGYTPDEWRSDAALWLRTVHDDDRERVAASWATSVATGAEFHIQYRYVHRDGRTVWVRDGGLPVRDASGEIQF